MPTALSGILRSPGAGGARFRIQFHTSMPEPIPTFEAHSSGEGDGANFRPFVYNLLLCFERMAGRFAGQSREEKAIASISHPTSLLARNIWFLLSVALLRSPANNDQYRKENVMFGISERASMKILIWLHPEGKEV